MQQHQLKSKDLTDGSFLVNLILNIIKVHMKL